MSGEARTSTPAADRRRILRWIGERRRRVVILSISSLVGGLLEAAFLVLVTRVAFALADDVGSVTVVGEWTVSQRAAIGLALLLVLARLAASLWSNRSSAAISNDVISQIRSELASAFLGASWSVKQREPDGRLQELLTTFASNGASLIAGLTSGVSAACTLAAFLALALVVDPLGAVSVVVAISALAFALRPLRSAVRKQSATTADSSMAFATTLNELAQLGLEVEVFDVVPETERRIRVAVDQSSESNRRLAVLRGLVPSLYSGLAYLALLAALGAATVTDSSGVESLGAVLLVMLRSLSYGQNLQSSVTTVVSSLPFLEQLDEQLDAYRASAGEREGRSISSIGEIRFAEVSFEYQPGVRAIDSLDATIGRGEIIGVVGPSGSGKSTLVQLLLGLRQPTSGAVLVDGRSLDTLDQSDWRRLIAFVPQTPRLLSGSIRDNVRFLRSRITEVDIDRALRAANLVDDLAAWPEGPDRHVGPRGGRLSGGQQQRVAIARALAGSPEVIVLDEPTSALDPRSEVLIREALGRLRGTTTVVIVAHRLSTLTICDRIMVIQDGRLSAFASRSELEAESEFYREALESSDVR